MSDRLLLDYFSDRPQPVKNDRWWMVGAVALVVAELAFGFAAILSL